MVNHSLDATFAALADPTRRAILARLARGETSITELAAPFEMSLPAVLKHVDTLARAGLVEARKEGRVRRCRLAAAPLQGAAAWITRYRGFWEERLDALERYLTRPPSPEKEDTPWPPPAPRSPSGSRAGSRSRGSASSARSSKPRR